jgi:Helix-turn-helix domain
MLRRGWLPMSVLVGAGRTAAALGWRKVQGGTADLLGALEAKAMLRLARERGKDWTPVHAAILSFILAHHNRKTGYCSPRQNEIATFCNVSVRTVKRYTAELRDWGALRVEQAKSLSEKTFCENQYAFGFPVENLGIDLGIDAMEPGDRNARAGGQKCPSRGTKMPEPGDTAVAPAIRRSQKDLSQKDLSGEPGALAPPPHTGDLVHLANSPEQQRMLEKFKEEGEQERRKPQQSRSEYCQSDFDERDWRKLQAELRDLYLPLHGARLSDDDPPPPGHYSRKRIFRTACQRAGITVERGQRLVEQQEAGLLAG